MSARPTVLVGITARVYRVPGEEERYFILYGLPSDLWCLAHHEAAHVVAAGLAGIPTTGAIAGVELSLAGHPGARIAGYAQHRHVLQSLIANAGADERFTAVERAYVEGYVVSILAPIEAELRLIRESRLSSTVRDFLADRAIHTARNDAEYAYHHTRRLAQSDAEAAQLMAQFQAQAIALVYDPQHWRSVTRLAALLLRRGALDAPALAPFAYSSLSGE